MSDDLTFARVVEICQAAGADDVVFDVDSDTATGESRARAVAYFPDGHTVIGWSDPYRPLRLVDAKTSRVAQAMRALVNQLRPTIVTSPVVDRPLTADEADALRARAIELQSRSAVALPAGSVSIERRTPDFEVTINRRGVERYGDPVPGMYGERVSVRGAFSAQFGAHSSIWLLIEDPLDEDFRDPTSSMSARMTVDQAIAVRDRLDFAIQRAHDVEADEAVSR